MAINRSNMGKEIQKAPSSPSAKKKIATVMDEYGKGILTSGSGKKVTNRDQALAIALAEGRGATNRAQRGMGVTTYRDSLSRRFGNPETPMMRDMLMRKAQGKSTTPERPVPRAVSDEELKAQSARIAAEKQRRAEQRVKDEEARKRDQEAHERVTGRKLPRGD
jgi:hypothetical protein